MAVQDEVIYLDNAATSWPKPPAVAEAMAHYLDAVGASPGRSAHRRAIEAAGIVYDVRAAIAELLGSSDPLRVIFTKNVTEALNLVLLGLLRPGDHVIAGSMEHNSVMRPLRHLERTGVSLTLVRASPSGEMEPDDFRRALRPTTRLIVLNHASNVTGTIAPVAEIGDIARRAGVLFVVDTAQTAGSLPLHMEQNFIDVLCFTGHKGLLGPQGTGGMIVGERVPLELFDPLTRGGTGSRSEEEEQPGFLPDKFESGTLNIVGIAGLGGGLDFVRRIGVTAIRAHEMLLTERLLDGLRTIVGVSVYGPHRADCRTATISFHIAGMSPSEAGLRLDEEFGILCRVGLHCAPAAHRTIGTFPIGTIRFSLGFFNTLQHVDRAIEAVDQLAHSARRSS